MSAVDEPCSVAGELCCLQVWRGPGDRGLMLPARQSKALSFDIIDCCDVSRVSTGAIGRVGIARARVLASVSMPESALMRAGVSICSALPSVQALPDVLGQM